MACGCRKQFGNFSSQQNTWTPSTSLTMSNWDPYPELQNPKNLYGANTLEKYCPSSSCAVYRIDASPVSLSASTPILERTAIIGGRNFREAYQMEVKEKSYLTIKDIWNTQKPYSS